MPRVAPTRNLHAGVDRAGSCRHHLFPPGLLVTHLADVLNGCLNTATASLLQGPDHHILHGRVERYQREQRPTLTSAESLNGPNADDETIAY